MTEAPCELCVCVIPGSFDMQFDLQVGVGTLVVAKPMDAEVQSVYNMTVQVTDGTNFATAQVHTLFICYALSLLFIHSRPTCSKGSCLLSAFLFSYTCTCTAFY